MNRPDKNSPSYPRAKFRQAHKPGDADRDAILDHLCGSHIPGSISWIWGGGFYARIGEPLLVEKWSAGTAGEMLDWLRDQALVNYAGSEFARNTRGLVPHPQPGVTTAISEWKRWRLVVSMGPPYKRPEGAPVAQ